MLTKRGVTESVALDYLTLRRKKRAPVTESAIDRIESQATEAGVSLQEAIETCCANGWAGFNAEWAKSRAGSGYQTMEERSRAVVKHFQEMEDNERTQQS